MSRSLHLYFILWLLVLAPLGCSKNTKGGESGAKDINYPEVGIDVENNDTKDAQDDIQKDTYSIWTDPCIDCAWYFCGEQSTNPNSSLYRKQICINNCDDPPTVVYEGECEEHLECNPAQPIIEVDLPCQTLDGYPGTQDKICNKGQIQYTDCKTDCAEEVCNGIDDDCDGVVDEGFDDINEVCNNIDDNCNGQVDEDLESTCANECGTGDLLCIAYIS